LKQLQLIQILSIKNFGRAVPRFVAKMAARINRLGGVDVGGKRTVPRESRPWCAGKAGK
jgi:hypothetical protein